GRCVAEALNVDDNGVGPKAEALSSGIDDPQIRLMWNKRINVRSFEPVAFQQFLAEFGLLAHREFEDLLAILVHIMHLFLDRLFRRRMQTSSARHIQKL